MDMNFLNDEVPQGETLEDFLPEIEFQEEFEIPHATVICAGGQVVNIPVDPDTQTNGLPGLPLSQVLTSGRITWDSSAQFFIDRQPVGLEYLVQPGVRVATLGNVKGGAA
jgi:hypothetical protein